MGRTYFLILMTIFTFSFLYMAVDTQFTGKKTQYQEHLKLQTEMRNMGLHYRLSAQKMADRNRKFRVDILNIMKDKEMIGDFDLWEKTMEKLTRR